jgi:nucleoside-diphosphate-sugar epimerase
VRVVVTGATGNVGTSVVDALASDPAIESIVGLARRLPALERPKTTWLAADVRDADLAAIFRGADAVVHLAWRIQPSRDLETLQMTNVLGSTRVFAAAAEAGVRAIVYASSVGAYSPGPKDRAVDERWPTEGIPTSLYSRQKAAVERALDAFERERPAVRVVRLRKALVFKREAASEVRRLFLGPFVPRFVLRRPLVVPAPERLRFQAVHSRDAGEAYRLAVVREVRGAFNVAADPVLDPRELARILAAHPVPLPAAVLRAGVSLSWRLRLQPADPGWLDLALETPLLDTTRARDELGWTPRRTASQALRELIDGLLERAGLATPPLAPESASAHA